MKTSYNIGDRVRLAKYTPSLKGCTTGIVVSYYGNHDRHSPRVRWVSGWGTTHPADDLAPLADDQAKAAPIPSLEEGESIDPTSAKPNTIPPALYSFGEAVADLTHNFSRAPFWPQDSREFVRLSIEWAHEFDRLNAGREWDGEYMEEIDAFFVKKYAEHESEMTMRNPWIDTPAAPKLDDLTDLLAANLSAWDDEEESVKEEHAELIERTRNALENL